MEGGRREGGVEAGGRTKVIVRELEGRHLSGGREGDEGRGGGRRRRKVGEGSWKGGRWEEGGREKRGRRDGGGEAGGLR